MEKAIPMGYLVSILTQLKYMFMTAFTHLGLFKSAEEAIYSGELHSTTTTTSTSNENNNHVLMWDGSSPCLVPVPIPVVTAFIKKTLPVVLFSDLLEGEDQSRGRKMNEHDSYDFDDDDDDDDDVDGGEERKEMGCSVCWDCIEGNHKIRELSWCSHVFHKECLDRWVDEGQHTCPLCRSMLLPPNTSPWLLLRNTDSHTPPTQQQQLHATATT
ncbi:hypothetical protein Vadar_027494 [Vaccinium darrowii]|uniref:Uncharacterized protein n=1 Tax=Vaccinium darrowii TaxID=229202 RepID=A0ACB7XKI5_9ERIC|nr:hypothetical protein Vadar_027494 [Vaccinium darrowii]